MFLRKIKSIIPLFAALCIVFTSFASHTIVAQQLLTQLTFDKSLYDVAWSPDDEWLAVAMEDGIGIYTNRLIEVTYLQTGSVHRLSWSPDTKRLASIAVDEATVKIWRWNADEYELAFEQVITNEQKSPFVVAVSWSPDGQHLAIVAEVQPPGMAALVGGIEIWDTTAWTSLIQENDPHQFLASWLEWSDDSRFVAGGANICGVSEFYWCDLPYFYVVDAVSGSVIYRSDIYLEGLSDVQWMNDYHLAVTTDEQVLIFDTQSDQDSVIYTLEPRSMGRLCLEWNSDAGILVVGSTQDGSVQIIAPPTKAVIHQFQTGGLYAMDLSGHGDRLAIIDRTRTIIEVWALPASITSY